MTATKLEERIVELLAEPQYQPIKPKAIARKLGVGASDYSHFRTMLSTLIRRGRIEVSKKNTLRLASSHQQIVGVFRPIRRGGGWVHPKPGQGKQTGDIYVRARNVRDAAGGDLVMIGILKTPRAPNRAPEGVILEVIERASSHFVGTYFTHAGESFVKVDGSLFHEDIYVGDPGAKGARDGDKVVFEMLRFPSPDFMGEGVLTEVLGPRGEPGVDLLSIIREFHLPDTFSEESLAESRQQARRFEEQPPGEDRVDLTDVPTLTIDPPDARDFDDAISLSKDEKGFWHLDVHIADVATFVAEGSELDREARARATSVYLPGRVIPMLPELISNGLASLQEAKNRFVKTVRIEFDLEGRITHTAFYNATICVDKRLTYPQVMEIFGGLDKGVAAGPEMPPVLMTLLTNMRALAQLLRGRRRNRGMFELQMPEADLNYDEQGRVVGAHYSHDDESHQLIEEFMVTANEAVAQKLASLDVSFLRRIHEIPDPLRLKSFAEFVRSLGVKVQDYRSRFEIQEILRQVIGKPEAHAVHYALLRSMKEAIYSPEIEGHYALASDCYCHFTSPIRRYPDLVVHRMLDQFIRTGKTGSTESELVIIGEHCSFAERRAAKAERTLVRMKLIAYLADRIGEEMEMVITGVEEYGFFAQGTEIPAEGMIHISTLTDDYYHFDRAFHSLVGRQRGRQFRLGDRIRCVVWKVDQEERSIDLRLADDTPPGPAGRMGMIHRSTRGGGRVQPPPKGRASGGKPPSRKKTKANNKKNKRSKRK